MADSIGELADKARLMVGDYALRQTLLLTDDPATLGSALTSCLERLAGEGSRVRIVRVVMLDADGKFGAADGSLTRRFVSFEGIPPRV